MRKLNEVCAEIRKDWYPLHPYAKPYFDAMRQMETVHTPYYEDSGKDVVLRFLSNATTWRGETARRIKKELKDMLKEKP